MEMCPTVDADFFRHNYVYVVDPETDYVHEFVVECFTKALKFEKYVVDGRLSSSQTRQVMSSWKNAFSK